MDFSSCLSVSDHCELDNFMLSKTKTEPQLVSSHQKTHDTASKNTAKGDVSLSVKKIKIRNVHQKTEVEPVSEYNY